MIGNLWAIVVTGGIGFVSFYSVLVIINNNSEKESVDTYLNQKPRGIPKIDPDFLMDSETQKRVEMWLPSVYFATVVVTTLILKRPLM